MADERLTIIAWGVLPPPIHGQSVMNEATCEVMASRHHLMWFNPTGSRLIHEVGQWSVRKLYRGVRTLVQFTWTSASVPSPSVNYISLARSGNGLYRDMLAWLISLLTANRTIVHIHTGELGFLRPPGLLSNFLRRLLRRSEAWTQIESWGQELVGLGAVRSKAVISGVRCPHASDHAPRLEQEALGHEPLHVVFVSNLAIGKGVDIFIKVISPLVASGRVRATIAGAAFEPETEALVRPLVDAYPASASRIAQLDSRARCGLLQTADVLLFPSRFNEGPGLVVCEAMEHGVVPIVSDRGALPHVVDGVGFSCSHQFEYTEALLLLSHDRQALRDRSVACVNRWESDFSLSSYQARVATALAHNS